MKTGPAARKPRLLFLSHRVPFPPHNGAAIRTWNILRLLATEFEIAGICYDRPDQHLHHMAMADRMAALEEYGRFSVVPIPQVESRVRLGWDHARSLASGRPYTWYVHDVRAARDELRRLQGWFLPDVVHVDSLDMVRLLPLLDCRRTVVTHHNVESQLLERRAAGEASAFRRWYLQLQAERLRAAEARWMPEVAANVVVSPEDAETFRAIAPEARYTVVPNGVDVDYFRPVPAAEEGCVFVGGTTWHPNRDALGWFAEEVLPALRARGETAPVTWVGRVTEEERRRWDGVLGLRLTGYVEDIRPYVAGAACFIAPLRFGGGTRLKLLDAWAMGKAIVTTSAGAEGLGAVPERDLLIGDDVDAFVTQVQRVLRDRALRRALGTRGREEVESRFSWEVIGKRMCALYLTLAAGGAVRPLQEVPGSSGTDDPRARESLAS
jgi:glycosyltransferase involved in cell wall biosynthesis